MNGFNRCIIAGNLTREPELRYSPQGVPVAKVSLAINRKWRGEDGQDREEVTFVDCTAFRGTAECLSQYKRKGDPLLIEGRLKLEQWEDKQTGQKRQKLGVIIESMTFIDGGKREGAAPAAGRTAREQVRDKATDANGQPPEEDDCPF